MSCAEALMIGLRQLREFGRGSVRRVGRWVVEGVPAAYEEASMFVSQQGLKLLHIEAKNLFSFL